MHPERLIMENNLVQNYISDNFHFDHKVVRSNLNFWASLVVPGHKRGPLFRVAQVLAGGINRTCVLHTYEDVKPSKHLGHPDLVRLGQIFYIFPRNIVPNPGLLNILMMVSLSEAKEYIL